MLSQKGAGGFAASRAANHRSSADLPDHHYLWKVIVWEL
jgi:hypothetical protein